MSCGYELTHLRPEKDEYDGVKDQDVKEVLQYIFRDNFPNTIEQVKCCAKNAIVVIALSEFFFNSAFSLTDSGSSLFLC